MKMLQRVVSGGQTGVDRAALDAALELGVPCGGWCPKGRKAEDGLIPERYPLRETPSEAYEQRTVWNVRDSDGTLAMHKGFLTGGTLFTVLMADRIGKPRLEVNVREEAVISRILSWLKQERISVLNVAGPRESGEPGIYSAARAVMVELLQRATLLP